MQLPALMACIQDGDVRIRQIKQLSARLGWAAYARTGKFGKESARLKMEKKEEEEEEEKKKKKKKEEVEKEEYV